MMSKCTFSCERGKPEDSVKKERPIIGKRNIKELGGKARGKAKLKSKEKNQ